MYLGAIASSRQSFLSNFFQFPIHLTKINFIKLNKHLIRITYKIFLVHQ
ncbi:BnaA10g11400D [Brassica napus]|uniref:BnaA10g11400D protein n=1 Tax=Brassica napus TaxID=3708 RepID=A0A078HK90_BRANA|nr:BnaA10g11400D [Brassica napus]